MASLMAGWPQVFCSAQGLSWRPVFARASEEAWEGGTWSRSPQEVSFGLGLEPVMCRPGTRGPCLGFWLPWEGPVLCEPD